ncbi:unnamed protein product [Linum tenue]|uniref:Inositol polyphosphate-related phosphatase domain-containing protein n=1 Tax=Linum tenue TaxID=586396 RepID=A0AAV0ITL5_9ROSI|nr:unnamed protein product [Linum tenue]
MLRLAGSTNNFVSDFPTATNGYPSTIITSLSHSPAAAEEEALMSSRDGNDLQQDIYKVFVGSWNVGGISPPEDLDLRDWLDVLNNDGAGSPSPDIYVLGFQEVVPLRAGNIILGSSENHGNYTVPFRWNSAIEAALNNDGAEEHYDCLVSKQMVGIFITVWVKRNVRSHIRHTAVSSVGCGLMGCFGNKGSVSVRFYVEKTSFCFVCSHLASGGKDGDERFRNANAGEIMSRTNFPRRSAHLRNLPRKILHHDRVVWLGDLNYRIYLPETTTRFLVQKGEWNVLLEKDQLKAELTKGRVFEGWQEGRIQFPPTYKYCPSSGLYYGIESGPAQRPKPSKGRAPAWCDRVIWFGDGLKQSQYERRENQLSDHRPIRAIFTAQVDKLSPP